MPRFKGGSSFLCQYLFGGPQQRTKGVPHYCAATRGCPAENQRISHPASLSEDTLPALASRARATPCERLYGGYYHPTESFVGRPTPLQYYLARQGRHVVLRGSDVTQPFYKSRLNWVPDPAPPAPRRLDDLVSPAAASANPTPPSEAHPRLPGRSRRKRRRKRKAAAPTNENSAPRAADLATQPTLSANRNSARWASSKATQPGSTGNGFPEVQPGTRSASVKHSQSFTSSPLTQHPVPATNRNSDRPFCLDQPGMTPDRIRLPIEIRPAGLPAKRPSLGQRPMAFQKFSLEPGVLQ